MATCFIASPWIFKFFSTPLVSKQFFLVLISDRWATPASWVSQNIIAHSSKNYNFCPQRVFSHENKNSNIGFTLKIGGKYESKLIFLIFIFFFFFFSIFKIGGNFELVYFSWTKLAGNLNWLTFYDQTWRQIWICLRFEILKKAGNLNLCTFFILSKFGWKFQFTSKFSKIGGKFEFVHFSKYR